MRALFTDESLILEEIRGMDLSDREDREDRAAIHNFYHGEPPISAKDLRAMGFKENVNFLTGHQVMSDSIEQMQAVYVKPIVTYHYTLKDAPEQFKASWEKKFTRKVNEVLKDSGKFIKPALDFTAEAVFYGTGVPHWKDDSCLFFDSLPLGEYLVPRGSPQDILEVPYDAYVTNLTVKDLIHYLKVAESDVDTGWDKSALKKLLKLIYDSKIKEPSGVVKWDKPEYLANLTASGSDQDRFSRTTIDVYYWHQCRYDLPGNPIERRIMLADSITTVIDKDLVGGAEGFKTIPRQIYMNEREYASQLSRVCPVHLATNLTANPMFHKIIGMGYLNFEIDRKYEIFLNRLNESLDESMRNLWSASEGGDADELETFLFTHNGIVPEGLQLLQNRIHPNLDGAFSMMGFLEQLRNKNSRGSYSNQGDRNTDQLEKQFMANQIASSDRATNRMSLYNTYNARVGREVARRCVNTDIMPEDSDYSEIMEIQEYMFKEGLDISYFNEANIKCTMVQLPGDGNSVKQNRIYMHYRENFDRYAPEIKPEILKEMHYIATSDYEQAERFIKDDSNRDTSQITMALNENNTMRLQGVSPPIAKDHVDLQHVPIHFQDMQAIIVELANTKKLNTAGEQAFTVLGGHVKQHIDRMQSYGQHKEVAQFMQVLSKLANVYDRLGNASEKPDEQGADGKPQQGKEERELQVKEKKVEIDQQKLMLQMRDMLDDNLKWMRTQENREKTAAAQIEIQKGQLDISRGSAASKDSELTQKGDI